MRQREVAHRKLVGAAREHQRADALAGERHGEGLNHNRVKAQQLGVQLNRAQRPGCNYHTLEALQYRLQHVFAV